MVTCHLLLVTRLIVVAKLENQVHGCHGLTVTLLFFIQNVFGHGETVVVAKLENQVHGCHGLTVTLLFLPKNSLNIAVLIQILFGHGLTMTE